MSADSWFQNTSWGNDVAIRFEEKLRRARRKEQYLRIQASYLAHCHPSVAHALLDRYFALQDDFDHAQAHVDRAIAYLAEGKINEAIASYENALQRETEFSKLLTQAYVDLPYLVATQGIAAYYPRAIEILKCNRKRLMFPVDHFKWNAAQALIAKAIGQTERAKIFAESALAAADQEKSGFRNHPGVGLVSTSFSNVVSALREFRDA